MTGAANDAARTQITNFQRVLNVPKSPAVNPAVDARMALTPVAPANKGG